MTDQAATVTAEPDENDEHCCDSYYYISDFSFAFNNSIFSDRVLHIEVVSDPVPIPAESHSLAPTAPNSKRRRKHTSKDDVSEGNDTSLSRNCYKVQRVRTIHISSVILAGKSRYFYELFSNGMRELKQRNVTLRIHASEEDALMDLLSFIHSNTLSRTTPAAVLDLLVVADKFEVASCIRYCSRMLTKLPMTCDIALLYLDLPLSIMMRDAIQPVINLAKLFLAKHYREITKFVDEVLNLPLAGLEAVLSSDDLQMASEDAVYDFVLKWARIHYPKVEERRDVLGSRLSRFIRFPYMSSHKLKKVLTCNDFHPDHASKVVFEALFFKADTPYRQRSIAAKNDGGTYHRYVERAYKFLPVNVVEFQLPRPRCFAYFDLKKEECANLFPNSRFYSRAIPLGRHRFLLSAHCHMDPQNASHCFGLFLGLQDKGLVSITVDYEFAARSKPGEEYIVRFKGNYTFTGGKVIGYRNLFGVPWDVFMADNSHYFINGILHLRAELSIR